MVRTPIARILRVNHGGEHGAIRIYSAQISVARWRCPDLLPFLRETLTHEREHLARFRNLMPSRASKPCRLMWLWGAGGLMLGFVTALLGRQGVLLCTEAVESTVHRHLDDQLRYVRDRDAELAGALTDIQRQEREHLDFAADGLGELTAFDRPVRALIVSAAETLIWLSTRGDSLRLARELA
jgi:ubiquinone biosynthesis monooxygenase Coq7